MKPSTVKDIIKCRKEITNKIKIMDIQIRALKIIEYMVIDLRQSKSQTNFQY